MNIGLQSARESSAVLSQVNWILVVDSSVLGSAPTAVVQSLAQLLPPLLVDAQLQLGILADIYLKRLDFKFS